MQPLIAIIPAKQTSIRVRNKNLRDLGGWPLLRYSIEAAGHITGYEYIFVSSESDEILAEAEKYGARPLMRPPELSLPHVKNIDVLTYSLREIGDMVPAGKPDHAVLLQPTHPFRLAEDLDRASRLFMSDLQPDYVLSVKPISGAVGWVAVRGKSITMLPREMDGPDNERLSLHENAGSFYFFRIAAFLRDKKLAGKNAVAFPLSRPELEVDLDTETDFVIARALFDAYSDQLDFKPQTLLREYI